MDKFPPAAGPGHPVIEPPDRGVPLEVLELPADPVWRGNDVNPNVYWHLARRLAGRSAQGREVR